MLLHDAQRGPATFAADGERLSALGALGPVLEQKAGRRDVRLMAVLLEEHPLKYQSPEALVFGKKFAAAREIGEDRVRLGENEALVVEDWRAAVGVEL